ncbi:DUF3024 domain-containing protein [Shewanella sp. YIC-542]|uniref:DUF3024 domain-containing protein n=1 Tax=Shewanella mytili TaxID=3377111 RepID=UPI00398F7ED1
MAFCEIEQARYKKAVMQYVESKRPAPHIRKALDIGFRLHGQSIELFEVRPRWDDPAEILEIPVAKATYVKTRKQWKVFWMRADLKWHGYTPHLMVNSLQGFFSVVDADEHGCFWG